MDGLSEKREKYSRGKNPNSLKNLEINRNGRPIKNVCITSWLKEYADQKITKIVDTKTLTFAQASALNMWKEAVKGDLQKYEFIVNRIEGKIADKLEVEDKTPQAPLEIELDDDKFAAAFSVLAKAGVTVDQIKKN